MGRANGDERRTIVLAFVHAIASASHERVQDRGKIATNNGAGSNRFVNEALGRRASTVKHPR